MSSVSCTGPSFCEMLTFADGTVETATWNGKTVGNGNLDSYLGFGPAPSEGFLSCVTPTFCIAVDQLGNAFTFNGSSLSKPTALDPGWAQAATWSGPSAVDPGATPGTGLTSVSCPDAAYCVATDWEGNALLGTG